MSRNQSIRVKIIKIERRLQRIGLDEPVRIPRLRPDIDADHVEACAVKPHAGTTGAAEQIKGKWASRATCDLCCDHRCCGQGAPARAAFRRDCGIPDESAGPATA